MNGSEQKINRILVDYEMVTANARFMMRDTGKNILAVVKNNSYNFGLKQCVNAMIVAGVKSFAVATLDEAAAVKNINSNVRVLMLNPAFKEEIPIAKRLGVSLSVAGVSWLTENKENLGGIELNLKINIGMNRFGVKTVHEAVNAVNICKESGLRLAGLSTHFPLAEESDLTEHTAHIDKFAGFYDELKKIHEFSIIHSENSATVLQKQPKLEFCNYVRPGILLYGYSPALPATGYLPSLKVLSKVIDIHSLEPGDNLGYSKAFTAVERTKIAVVPMGYGDGILRARKALPVLINGNKYFLAGKIFMSHFFVIVDDSVRIGDDVEVYGENIRLDELPANDLGQCSEQTASLHMGYQE